MRRAIRPSPFLVIFTVGAKLNVVPSLWVPWDFGGTMTRWPASMRFWRALQWPFSRKTHPLCSSQENRVLRPMGLPMAMPERR